MEKNNKQPSTPRKGNDHYFYVLLCADNTLYGGYTTNLAHRVQTHNAGKGAKYTKVRRPVKCIYYEHYSNQHDAMHAEWAFKHQPRAAKLAYLKAHGVAVEKLPAPLHR